MKKKVIISACLLGEYCRYDGETKSHDEVLTAFSDYEVIPFCPEAPLFGTPRERISVIEVDGENRIITDETGEDVTEHLENEIDLFIEKNLAVDRVVLKSKSPSCGLKTTPILDKNKNVLKVGNGIAAEMFLQKYKNIKITDELEF